MLLNSPRDSVQRSQSYPCCWPSAFHHQLRSHHWCRRVKTKLAAEYFASASWYSKNENFFAVTPGDRIRKSQLAFLLQPDRLWILCYSGHMVVANPSGWSYENVSHATSEWGAKLVCVPPLRPRPDRQTGPVEQPKPTNVTFDDDIDVILVSFVFDSLSSAQSVSKWKENAGSQCWRIKWENSFESRKTFTYLHRCRAILRKRRMTMKTSR